MKTPVYRASRLITTVWLALSVATGISWWLGTESSMTPRQLATVGLTLIAMIKVRLVILYFMEVRTAPLPLRLICETWVIAVGAVIIGFYLLGSKT